VASLQDSQLANHLVSRRVNRLQNRLVDRLVSLREFPLLSQLQNRPVFLLLSLVVSLLYNHQLNLLYSRLFCLQVNRLVNRRFLLRANPLLPQQESLLDNLLDNRQLYQQASHLVSRHRQPVSQLESRPAYLHQDLATNHQGSLLMNPLVNPLLNLLCVLLSNLRLYPLGNPPKNLLDSQLMCLLDNLP
jgi:hypothetical protein